MDGARVGRAIRGLRRRRRWRQVDLAERCGLSQSSISHVERGHVEKFSLDTMQKIAAALDASVSYDVRWRGGALDRLIDERHGSLVARILGLLHSVGWLTEVEVSYSEYGERGSIDILAFHPGRSALLVVEAKTELVSAEETIRKLDEKARLGPRVARSRLGWSAASVSRALVFPESLTARRRVHEHAKLFESAYPLRGRAVRRWLRDPTASVRGVLFLSVMTGSGGSRNGGGPQRVRLRTGARSRAAASVSDRR